MAYLVKADLTPPLYQNILDEISRNDASVITKAIGSGILEAKGYLTKYDTTVLFSGTFDDENLKDKVKDLVAWRLVKLANPNISMDVMKVAREEAIAWFKDVQKGISEPPGWPPKPQDPSTSFDEGSLISSSSIAKRQNNW